MQEKNRENSQKEPNEQKNQKTDRLTDDCRQCRSRSSHVQAENQQRIEKNVQQSSDSHAPHCHLRLSFGAQDVIQNKRSAGDRRRKQNIKRIIHRIGHHGIGTAQKFENRAQKA